ncbi:hypothetical protein, partial [Nocardia heshunensis]
AMTKVNSDFKKVVKLEVSEMNFKISCSETSTGISQMIDLEPKEFSGAEISLSCNSQYLVDALEALTSMKDIKFVNMEVKINSGLTPFLISAGNIDYLLTPVKVF